MEGPEDVGGEGTLWEREDHQEGGAQFCSRSPCCVLLALPWNTTNENPSTDKLSRAINYQFCSSSTQGSLLFSKFKFSINPDIRDLSFS